MKRVQYRKEALAHAKALRSQFVEVAPLLEQLDLPADRMLASFNNVISTLESGQEPDNFLLFSLWFAGQMRPFADSICEAAATGMPAFHKITDAHSYLKEKAQRELAESQRIDRENRDREALQWQEQQAEAERIEREALLKKVGLSPAQIAKIAALEVE
jgi:hypothetical protein